jgi:2-polyprenyl-3-methyl-5-hydroxy-6-metoxy-1,4-benzoquinol methylase
MNKPEKFWDKVAKNYLREEKKDELNTDKIIEKTKKYLDKNFVVLDYGCGPGIFSNKIADCVKMIYAVDISSQMIDAAKKKSDQLKVSNVEYIQSTIFDERFKKETFDVLLVFNILHLLEDTHLALQRMNELLKPGGLIISITPCLAGTTFLRAVILLGSKLGILPKISSFKFSEVEDLILTGNFEIIETECTQKSTQQYFVAAKKR